MFCRQLALTVSLAFLLLPVAQSAFATDWPMWRYDANRSAASPEKLPAELYLQWVRELPPLKPAWPDEPRANFDAGYEPVVMGKTMFIGSSRNDSLTALDTDTGTEKWRFYADGPVRFAPVAWNDKVYFVSDDGFLYCLDAANGTLLWKFCGAPSGRKVLGSERLISSWPARGGPVPADGKVYFAAGIWPFMGVFIYALDAETGEVIWTNDGSGSLYILQPHNSPAFAGVAPQGYLAAIGDRLLVPNGRSVSACFDRHTGQLLYYHHGRNNKNGSCHTAAVGKYFANSGRLFDLATGDALFRISNEPVLTEEAIYVTRYNSIRALDIKNLSTEQDRENERRRFLPELWNVSANAKVHIKAGRRLYASAPNVLMVIDVPDQGGQPTVSWEAEIEGTPWTMLAADGKLFVVTVEGGIYCFGGKPVKAKTLVAKREDPRGTSDEWSTAADRLLEQTGVTEGYCLVLGAGCGRLMEELALRSDLRIIAVDPDAKKIEALRRKLDAAGLYGSRIAAHVGDILSFQFPPYLAGLIVSEDLNAAGFRSGKAFVEKVFHVLRPYGGVACLPVPSDRQDDFAKWVTDAEPANAEVKRAAGFALLKRVGPLPGSADWTHQYADAANTVVSKDKLVKAPLGVLWFGGSSNQKILPRHGHGPSEQVLGGRLFIEGPDTLRAMDVYTGRLLWEKYLPGFGVYYNTTSHQPGANSIGSNYVSVHDGIYAAYGKICLRLDPATGKTVSVFTLPTPKGVKESPTWGYIGIREDLLVAGASPASFGTDIEFSAYEFRRTEKEEIAELGRWIRSCKDVNLVKKRDGETELDFVVTNLNRLLNEESLLKTLPRDERPLHIRFEKEALQEIEEIQRQIDDYLKTRNKIEKDDSILKKLNRKLLNVEGHVRFLPRKQLKIGAHVTWSGTASKRLVVMNRYSGEVLWTRDAANTFGHNSIAIGGGKVFCIDKLPEVVVRAMKRRGKRPKTQFRLLALDARKGTVIWSTSEDIFGTWLGYSEEYDILLQAGRPSRDMLPEPNDRLIAYQGTDGMVVWDKSVRYDGPCMLHHQTIIAQGSAFDLLTGETKMRRHPLTGALIPWRWTRNHGCNSAIASENLVTFRSAAAGFFDLTNDGGTGNLGGFRSGCTSNLIAANGVLNAPDYTRTCICSYQNQTSLALVHMPEVEMWTLNDIEVGEEPVKRVGINFGAPGDRLADNGTLWLEYPSSGSPSPDIPIRTIPEKPEWFRRHSSRINGDGLKWVGASGAKGMSRVTITLAGEPASSRIYTVRLHFAEPEYKDPGRRIFDVGIQGKQVLKGFDVVKESGGRAHAIIREFKNINIKDNLTVTFNPSDAARDRVPIICGIEAIAEGW